MPDPTPRPGGPRVPIPALHPADRTRLPPTAPRQCRPAAGSPAPMTPRASAGTATIWRRYALSDAWQWQDFAAMRSRTAIRGKTSPWCVPRRQSVAIFSLHASPKGPRTGKAPLPGKIHAPCIQNELALERYTRRVSEKPRKSPFGNASREDLARKGPFSLHGPLESCTTRESCHPVSTNRPGARNPCAAERREPPATTTPKRNSKANGMDWMHYVERFCENRESEEGSGRAENADVLAKTNPKEKN